MENRFLIGVLGVVIGLVFVGGVLAQETSAPKIFSGIITKVDLVNKEIVLQNQEEQMTFQWTHETKVNGPPAETGGSIPENLKEGMRATVLYGKGSRSWVASRIDVGPGNLKTLKGWEFPFECGVTVC